MIIPAILPKSIDDLQTKLALLNFAERLQVDVVDGKFDDDISWPYKPTGEVSEIKDLISTHSIEVDLMVAEPMSAGREWLKAGAKALVLHIESLEHPQTALELKKEFNFELGFAISNDTDLELLYPLVEKADFVQLMGIKEIGKQGQPFDNRVLERIATLHSLYPALEICVDGGVGLDTIEALKKAGTNRFVVGSVILHAENPHEMYEHLLKISK